MRARLKIRFRAIMCALAGLHSLPYILDSLCLSTRSLLIVMSSKVSYRLQFTRFKRFFSSSSRTEIAGTCRAVIDRCRYAKDAWRRFRSALVSLIDYQREKLAKLKPPTLLPVFTPPSSPTPLELEHEFNNISMNHTILTLENALTTISGDRELEDFLGKFLEIRQTLSKHESAYYNVLSSSSPGAIASLWGVGEDNTFQSAFYYSCELRSITTKAEICSRQLLDQFKVHLAKLASTHLKPIFALFGRNTVSHLLLTPTPTPPLSIPSISKLVYDLNKVCNIHANSTDFAQPTHSYTGRGIQPHSHSSANPLFPGIVAVDHLAPSDSFPLDRSEVLHVLANIHGFSLVRRCCDDNPATNIGLIPATLLKHYRLKHQPVHPQSNLSVSGDNQATIAH